ncbi:MAG: indolepyruvate ferredoxin oxidoreductase subunit alpha [Clostridia bacterium]|nr:indolepyruvate ferredoxin oxidoreductase subunit alpha [Clostridia bacterium]
MKKLMIGNEAIARGFWEAGCRFVSSYPGTPSTEITQFFAEYCKKSSEAQASRHGSRAERERSYFHATCEWAPNEKVALEAAFGASVAGARAAACQKHVGLNVAADPLFTLSYTGVNGGLVAVVADDPGMHSSQNEQDSRHYARAAKLPMLEPADSGECLAMTRAAFDLSEQYDTPVLIRTVTRISHGQSLVAIGERKEIPLKPYVKDPAKYVMMPGFATKRHPVVEQRMTDLAAFAETCEYNTIEDNGAELGIITAGACYQYVKEAFGNTANVLKLGLVHPLPCNKIKEFAAKCKRLVVVEELDDFIEGHCRALGLAVEGKNLTGWCGELSQAKIAAAFQLSTNHLPITADLPNRPPVMCAGCTHRGIFYILNKLKTTVFGDIGCYTLGASPPLSAMDTTLCMGASVSGLHGFMRVGGGSNTVAVIGDSTFIHSGITSLCDIAYNQSNSTVIILDNSTTGMTGHQHNPTTGYSITGEPAGRVDLEQMCRAIGINRVKVVDPYDLATCESVIREELAADEPSVIIARRPCALLKTFTKGPVVKVNMENCTGCRACMRIGCPAISMQGKKAVISDAQCVGCGVCKQLCRFEAMSS